VANPNPPPPSDPSNPVEGRQVTTPDMIGRVVETVETHLRAALGSVHADWFRLGFPRVRRAGQSATMMPVAACWQ
jgi:hypothetical protein